MKIDILGKTFVVEISNLQKKHSVNASGTCNNAQQKIMIDSEIVKEQQESTLLHEIIEAINFSNEMELPHSHICQLETGIYSAIKKTWKPFK